MAFNLHLTMPEAPRRYTRLPTSSDGSSDEVTIVTPHTRGVPVARRLDFDSVPPFPREDWAALMHATGRILAGGGPIRLRMLPGS
jgi:hypothetical protein